MNHGRGIDLEIVERTPEPDEVRQLNVVIPTHVTLNGLPVLGPHDEPITISIDPNGGVIAHLPLFVGRLRVHAERPPLDEPTPIFDALAWKMNWANGQFLG